MPSSMNILSEDKPNVATEDEKKPPASAADVIDAFLCMKNAAEELSRALCALPSEKWDGWVIKNPMKFSIWHPGLDALSAHQAAAAIYSSFHHVPCDDPRDTWQMPGLLMVPETVMDLASVVNLAKDAFAEAGRSFRENIGKKSASIAGVLVEYDDNGEVRDLLKRVGASRIHLRHCTRNIVTVKNYPESISLSWVQQRKSIKKTSIESCEEKLNRLKRETCDEEENSHIDIQLSLLGKLTADETDRLRQVQTVDKPSVKGRVYWSQGIHDELGYLSMPALIPQGGIDCRLPEHTELSNTPGTTKRRKRNDNLLEDTPLLPSIRVYLQKKV